MIEKFQIIIILVTVGLGLLLGQVPVIEQYAESMVIPALLFMLYGLFLTIRY